MGWDSISELCGCFEGENVSASLLWAKNYTLKRLHIQECMYGGSWTEVYIEGIGLGLGLGMRFG